MASERSIVMPRAPALAASPARAVWLEPDGAVETLALTEAAVRARGRPPLAVHGPATFRRLGGEARPFRSYDLLELFAFVRPAQFCLPTPNGLADAAGLPRPATLERAAETLFGATRALLAELARMEDRLGPLLEARNELLRLRRTNRALAQILNEPSQARLMLLVDRALPNAEAEFREWHYQQRELELVVEDPNPDPIAYVRALEAEPLFEQVRAERSRGENQLEISLRVRG